MVCLLPPAQVCEEVFLPDRARQALDGSTRMLVLAGIDDRLRAQVPQHPAHPCEFVGRYHKSHPVSRHFGFQAELATLLWAIVPNDIPHNSRTEIRDAGGLHTAILEWFSVDHLGPQLLVESSRGAGDGRGALVPH
jgi:hypothetical protein